MVCGAKKQNIPIPKANEKYPPKAYTLEKEHRL